MRSFYLTFNIGMGLLIALRLYWHWRAGTTRDRAAVRAGLAREGGFAAARWLIGLPAGVTLLLYMAAPGLLEWAQLPLAGVVRWSGAVLFGTALVLLAWVHGTLGTNFNTTLVVKADHELITSGPYRYVRHPMYTAFIALFTGMFLLSANLLLGVLGGLALYALLVMRTPREEAQLAERFGQAYETYRSRTGALLPRLGPK
jgi:protein-S-isoprenylcysteine O-methyltransferase Ste14